MKKESKELKDLYKYLQSKTIIHPINGRIKYKLFPYQKRILKEIHENDRLLIIKGRQIGISTLLSGYCGWRYNLHETIPVIKTIRQENYKELYKKIKGFESTFPKLITDGVSVNTDLYIYDEYNFNKNCGKLNDYDQFLYPGKHIITGTVDKQNKLYNLYYKLIYTPYHYNVVWYPVSKCKGSWNKNRINYIKSNFDDNSWLREMECCW